MDGIAGRNDRTAGISAWSWSYCSSISRQWPNGTWLALLEICLWRWVGITIVASDFLTIGAKPKPEEEHEWRRHPHFPYGIGGRLFFASYHRRGWSGIKYR